MSDKQSLIIKEDGKYIIDPAVAESIAEYQMTMDVVKNKLDELKKQLQDAMEKNKIIKLEGNGVTVSYIAPTTSLLFDSKAFKRDYPTSYDKYVKGGKAEDFPEVRNFQFLSEKYGFTVERNEVPVILFAGEIPIAAGRLDLVLSMPGNNGLELGLADIKCTSSLNREYLAYQLNLYRIAYQQCYGSDIAFLKGVHLDGDKKRRFVDIPINEDLAWDLVEEFINE